MEYNGMSQRDVGRLPGARTT